MTDTDHKEIEKIVYNSNNVIRDIVKWIEEDRERNQDNALVPLDEIECGDRIMKVIMNNWDGGAVNPAELYGKIMRVISKFGKDNSGMVPLDKKAITDSLGYPTNRLLTDKELSLINYICENFSQHPPKEPVHDCGCGMGESCLAIKKERKVSLEEFAKKLAHKDIPSKTWDDWSYNQQNWYYREANAILSLLNAVLDGKEGDKV